MSTMKPNREEENVEFEEVGGPVELNSTFTSLGLQPELMRGLRAHTFDPPNEIQQRALGPIVKGRDVLVKAEAGTGKHLVVGLLQAINTSLSSIQALFLTPSFDIADYYTQVMNSLGYFMNIRCHCANNAVEDGKSLEGVHIVCGTPDKVLRMIEQQHLSTNNIKIIIFDELDLILKNYKQQFNSINKQLASTPQVVIIASSITSQETVEVINNVLKDPVRVLVKSGLLLEDSKQYFITVEKDSWKLDVLYDLQDVLSTHRVIIYVNTSKKAEYVISQLKNAKLNVLTIKPEEGHKSTIRAFTDSSKGILVTSSLIYGVNLPPRTYFILHYDLPSNAEMYMHRIGRAVGINFVTDEDVTSKAEIEKFLGFKFIEMTTEI